VTVTRTTIDIAAPADVIYTYGSQTERWPEFLPHYRYVRVLEAQGATQIVAMSAWRDVFPVRWTARQSNDARTPRIEFQHLRGWTRGMDVAWTFEPIPAGTRVTIEHRLAFRFPIARAWLEQHVVSGYFIDGIARKTLARIKLLAERSAAEQPA
jgi:uncharacterized membrane protein